MPVPNRAASLDALLANDRILLVEPDAHFADLLVKTLSAKAGFGEITAVRTLEQAKERLAAEAYALVFLDLSLPDSRGLDSLAELRALAAEANILVLTSLVNEEVGLAALREGAHDYLVKGHVTPDALRRIARYALERRHAALALRRSQEKMEIQLRHMQKMEAIGQLAAGIAHEINTPLQFVGDNCRFLDDTLGELLVLCLELESAAERAEGGLAAARQVPDLERILERLRALDLSYLHEQVPLAIRQSLDGVAQISRIVSSMKDFSHPGSAELQPEDLNRIIDSTLVISRNAWKYVAKVETRFDPELPPVPCLAGEFNQVVLNLVVNAAHAIEQRLAETRESGPGTITLATRRLGQEVQVSVTDDGAGIAPEVLPRIFDPFFTTKPQGKGTGQGLAIAHSVVVDKHRGRIQVESEPGVGTTFTITLPLSAQGS